MLVHMTPVALAKVGTGLGRDTFTQMGWFGPRRLASVVFTLLAIPQFETVDRPLDILLAAATWTILFSVLAHGLSAAPLSVWYSRRLAQAPFTELAELLKLY